MTQRERQMFQRYTLTHDNTACLHVDNQTFTLVCGGKTAKQAKWMREQLAIALVKLLEAEAGRLINEMATMIKAETTYSDNCSCCKCLLIRKANRHLKANTKAGD